MRTWIFIVVVAGTALGSTPINSRAKLEQTALLRDLGANRWHEAGFRGQGAKVAVLDTGFRGYRNYLGKVLPSYVLAKTFRFDGDIEARNSHHGILCAEVVHAIAPDAELMFVSWQPESPDSFVEAVAFAKRAGAQIITCSVIMPCWSDGEGGGPTHAALNPVIGASNQPSDLLTVTCAGNLAKRHWAGHFINNGDDYHRWPNGSLNNFITPWGGEPVSIELCWSGNGSYLVIVTDEFGREVWRSKGQPFHQQSTIVRFDPKPHGRYAVRIRHIHGQPGPFHVVALGASLEQSSAKGSIPFPGDGPNWLTIGAWENGQRADYSSCGPNSATDKPDMVAPVPFASAWREQPFGGTSAAAPQAAAIAALYWSRHPQATAAQVRSALQTAARDVHLPGFDYETGYGLLQLPDLELCGQSIIGRSERIQSPRWTGIK